MTTKRYIIGYVLLTKTKKYMAKSRSKFITLAESRVSRVIQDLRLIGNLSNKSNYDYSEEDVEKIITTLKNEINKTQKRFESVTSKNKDIFKL